MNATKIEAVLKARNRSQLDGTEAFFCRRPLSFGGSHFSVMLLVSIYCRLSFS